jgi:cobaltochelatase CobN
LGFYHWIRDIWKADAVIHVGTHGTLEWLPGKGTALSEECYPDIALKDLPNIYPYWITVIGEGLQAKRRGASCLIGHISPPMSSAGTYDELSELEKLLDEYLHYRQNQPENVEVMKKLIREKAQKANLQNDISFITEEDFEGYVQRLHAYITDIKNMQIRTGLHVLGRVPEKEELIEYLIAMTNVDNGDIPSLRQTIAEAYGFNYYDLLEQSAKILNDKGKTYKDTLEDVQAQGRQLIEILAQYDFNLEKAEAIYQIPWVKETKEDIKDSLLKIARFICETLVPNLRRTRQEIDNLLKALEGFYVEPGPASAPTSGATDALPTGRNFYGIDPRMLPTPAAWEIGKKMGDDVIRRYLEEEGIYPESVGIVLWATSNERSHGQCIAEFLYLLGVKPVWQKGTYRVIDLEVIPLEELKRPRIDVTARISGLFRDSMPVCINLMDKAVNIVANLDEDVNMNYVRKHILEDVKNMEKEGIPKDEAWVKASYRIFGDPPGSYGAGVSDLLEAKNWENIHDLAKVYVRWGAHAYGKNAKGEYLPELFSQRLKGLNVTIQNEDNREISMLNSDDYNAYHGGMVAAVRSLKGKAPRSFCGDSSDRKK